MWSSYFFIRTICVLLPKTSTRKGSDEIVPVSFRSLSRRRAQHGREDSPVFFPPPTPPKEGGLKTHDIKLRVLSLFGGDRALCEIDESQRPLDKEGQIQNFA